MEKSKKFIILSLFFGCLVITLAYLLYLKGSNLLKKQKENTSLSNPNINLIEKNNEIKWKIKEVDYNPNEKVASKLDPTQTKEWEGMQLPEKYVVIDVLDRKYFYNDKIILSDEIKNYIKDDVLSIKIPGKEEYDVINISIYSLKDISEKCACAIMFSNDTNYYLYINQYYIPETLQDLKEDLNLEKNLSFESVYYEKSSEQGQNSERETEIIEFPKVDDKIIWKMLFDVPNTENVYNDFVYHQKVMRVEATIENLGCNDINILLCEDGFITINILGKRKEFYVGEETIQLFVDYVIENCEGYLLVYNGSDLNEKNDEQEDKIVRIENQENAVFQEYELNSNLITTNTTKSYNSKELTQTK